MSRQLCFNLGNKNRLYTREFYFISNTQVVTIEELRCMWKVMVKKNKMNGWRTNPEETNKQVFKLKYQIHFKNYEHVCLSHKFIFSPCK